MCEVLYFSSCQLDSTNRLIIFKSNPQCASASKIQETKYIKNKKSGWRTSNIFNFYFFCKHFKYLGQGVRNVKRTFQFPKYFLFKQSNLIFNVCCTKSSCMHVYVMYLSIHNHYTYSMGFSSLSGCGILWCHRIFWVQC